MTGCFLTLALICPTAPPTDGGLQKGDELTFVGTVEEAVDRPGARFRRSQKLEIRVLVLEKTDAGTDVAVLTLLRRKEDVVTGAVNPITGGAPEKAAPAAARLDLVRIQPDGSVHRLAPAGPPPLAFDLKTPTRPLPTMPLDTFAPFEFGMFPPRPPRSAPDKPWAVAPADPTRPAETWQVQGSEVVTGERCARLVVNQQHPNWAKPVGGHSAWSRADSVWVSELDGTARKVYRVVRHRDGLDTELAAWVEVKYELKDQTPRLTGRTFDRYRSDVETAFATAAEIAPYLPDAARHGSKFFEARLKKIDDYLEKADASSPYREAVQAVRRQLDAARSGASVAKPDPAPPSAPTPSPPVRPTSPEQGRLAPDGTADPCRLACAETGNPTRERLEYLPGPTAPKGAAGTTLPSGPEPLGRGRARDCSARGARGTMRRRMFLPFPNGERARRRPT